VAGAVKMVRAGISFGLVMAVVSFEITVTGVSFGIISCGTFGSLGVPDPFGVLGSLGSLGSVGAYFWGSSSRRIISGTLSRLFSSIFSFLLSSESNLGFNRAGGFQIITYFFADSGVSLFLCLTRYSRV
jgi:hypothetical protein